MSFRRILLSFLGLGLILFGWTAVPEKAVPEQTGSVQGITGDALVDATIGEASNFIPALASDTSSSSVTGQVYRGLVRFDRDLKLVPELAESFTVSDDQLTITFKLRPGLMWQDGKPLTSKDCLFTWKLMSDPQTPTPYGEPFTQIENALTPDDLTFIVTYKRPLARALVTWSFDIMPSHLLEGQDITVSPLARKPVGSGPFELESWEVGQRIIMKASDKYFKGRPLLDRLITRLIPDPATQLMELKTGAIDMMALTPDQWEEAQTDPLLKENYNFFRYPEFAYTYLGFNQKDPRLSDVRVRQAIAYALDKNEIIEGVVLGFGQPANGPFKPGMWANNTKVKPYPYDPKKAAALLAEAGWRDTDRDGYVDKDGRRFVLTIMTNQGNKVREQTGLVIQARLKEVGIEVKLRIIEWAAFLKEYLDKKDFEAIIMGWTIPMDPDLYDVWNSTKTKPGELNFISYNNPEVDRLIDEGRFTLEQAKRKEAYDRIQEIFFEDVPYVFLYVPDSLTAVSKRFIGPEVTAVGLGENLPVWYVPKDRQVYKLN
ncbi:MAG: peptide-binding protein [Deltaproteobacteria bacterium]|jgi:peptide/nickel transport system substrate-binding protein|nr:peptide-binding protein [Deltaproteobacteria bacterium]